MNDLSLRRSGRWGQGSRFLLGVLAAWLAGAVSTTAGPPPGWTLLEVPGVWETQAGGRFARHDGFAWYRCYVKVPDRWTSPQPTLWSQSVTITLEHVADAFEVYVNGRKVGGGGAMPPQFRSAPEQVFRFKVPHGVLRRGQYNTVAVRVYNAEGEGGFKGPAPVLAGYELECLLRGPWEFRPGDDPRWATGPRPQRPEAAVFEQFREAITGLKPPAQWIPGRRLSPQESFRKMQVASDLVLELVLSEPRVAQPLSVRFDHRGRMWVVQYRQYPYPAGLKMVSRNKYYRAVYDRVPEPPPRGPRGADRITVHEDTDGDGRFDRHHTFLQGLNIATSVAFDQGGVWVLNPPYLLFYPDRDDDARPDGPPVVHLRGFGLEDTHSVANNLYWGPDGWLYGVQGSNVTSRVEVVAPGPAGEKAAARGKPVYCEGPAIWRYHPQRRRYEIFAEGGGNAFGMEIDAQGRIFSGHNGSNTRGYYYVPGGYYAKGTELKYGGFSNPYTFGQLPFMRADSPIPRFSHALVRYEAPELPARYHGHLLAVDPLHRNVVFCRLEPWGSSFQTSDVEVVLQGGDIAFRPIDIQVGPDGAVYVLDFYEEFIAHGQHFQGQLDRTTGRIWRLRPRQARGFPRLALDRKSSAELVRLLQHPNKWYRQTALRLLAQRQDRSVVPQLRQWFSRHKDQLALESLWALYRLGQFDAATARQGLQHASAHVRRWSVRLLGDETALAQELAGPLAQLAREEPDAEVRAQLACSARRWPVPMALPVVAELLKHDEDLDDPFIPLLLWWAVEAHVSRDRPQVLRLLEDARLWQAALVRKVILRRLMRRLATSGTHQELLACAALLDRAPDAESRRELLAGFEQAFQGRGLSALPQQLVEALARAGGGSLELQLRQGNPQAVKQALALVADPQAPAPRRAELLRVLGEVKEPKALPVLLRLLRRPELPGQVRQAVLGALRNFDSPQIPATVLQLLPRWKDQDRQAALALLASRREFALRLLQAVEQGKLTPGNVPGELVQQMSFYPDPRIAALVRKHWPQLQGAAASGKMQKLMQRALAAVAAGPGNPYRGHELFVQSCAKCHMLFGRGGRVGPDLTAYQRNDVPRMLLHIINPSAEIREGFETYLVLTDDGRLLTGFLFDQDAKVIVLRGADGQNVTIPRSSIEQMVRQRRSLMPEGLLETMSDQDIRDLMAYLRSSQPVGRK